MKFTNRKAFEKHLIDCEQRFLSTIYLIQSKDASEISEAEEAVIGRYKEVNKGRFFDVKILSPENVNESDLGEFLEGRSLFKESTFFVFLREVDKFKAHLMEKIVQLLEVDFDCTVIASSSCSLATLPLYSLIEKKGVILDLDQEKPWEKQNTWIEWVKLFLGRKGIEIETQAALTLIKEYGIDKMQLRQEINKLVTYKGKSKKISIQDVLAICCTDPQDTIWQFLNAFLGKQKQASFRIATALVGGLRFSPIGLVRQMRGQIHTALQIASHEEQGKPLTELSIKYKGKMLDKQIELIKKWQKEELVHALYAIDEAESLLKNSGTNELLQIEILIGHLLKAQ